VGDLHGERASGEKKNSEEHEKTQVQININVIPGDTPKETGVVYVPVVRPKHHRDAGNAPPQVHPNPPHAGNFLRIWAVDFTRTR